MTRFLGLSSLEQEYFLELLEINRAESAEYRRFREKRLGHLRSKRRLVKDALSELQSTPENYHALYYSHWLFPALHMAVGIENYSKPKALAERIGLPIQEILAALEELRKMGFVELAPDGAYLRTQETIHVSENRWTLSSYHRNWRNRAVDRSGEPTANACHYTSVFSCSKKDFDLMREALLEWIRTHRDTVTKSSDEEIFAVCLDLFKA